jgi:YbgC/YbaW family acyl-CoA thioester hydrolase
VFHSQEIYVSTTTHYATFSSELRVRPDDIDMNNHVHNSRYLDYVLAARYDQMERCYKMSWEEFLAIGVTWVVTKCFIEFKRPLLLGELMTVTTGIEEIGTSNVKVGFSIHKGGTKKLSAAGYFEYAMIDVKTGKARAIPESIIKMYSI